MNAEPFEISFPRYLAAKKSVDDRALNRNVWEALAHHLPAASPEGAPRVLEIGAGIGTMLERMLDWGLLGSAEYTALDAMPENIASAAQRLPGWAASLGLEASVQEDRTWRLRDSQRQVGVQFVVQDLYDFAACQSGVRSWDLLVAHAFLDLVDIPTALPVLRRLLAPNGLFYFTLNFDGATILEPAIDPPFDALVESLYHRSMDERLTAGGPSGDSQSGRHLFSRLRAAGMRILAAGSSDWVVFAGPKGYPQDEACFLTFILHTLEGALQGHPELDAARFSAWLAERHAQLRRGELVYIAHQLDFLAQPA